MSALVEKWRQCPSGRSRKIPVSVRLDPDVDCLLQEVCSRVPGLTQTQVINDSLKATLSSLRWENLI